MKTLTIRATKFAWGSRTYLMGIINATPDSFSNDGLLQEVGTTQDWVERAVSHALEMVADGADIIDIGGESTKPGNTPVSEADELARVIPVITALRSKTDSVISIDTYKASVARAAIEAGADIVNDVWAFGRDPEMARTVASLNVPVILMHNRASQTEQTSELGGRFLGTHYSDLVGDITKELQTAIAHAHNAGIPDEHIIIDPGIGFGKSTEQNLELVRRMNELKLPYPLLVGPSRKSFVGYTLKLPPEERLEGTIAAVTLLIERGADIVRVHDVKAMKRVASFCDAVTRQKESSTSAQE